MILETFIRCFVDPDALDATVEFYKSLLHGEESLRFNYPEMGLRLASVSSPYLSMLVIAGAPDKRKPFEATRLTHGDAEAHRAQQTARARFGGNGADEGPTFVVSQPTGLVELAVQAGLVDSKNAAKRHIVQGGLKLNGQAQSTDRVVHPGELPALLSLAKRKLRLVAG